jgi:hypothetical protein
VTEDIMKRMKQRDKSKLKFVCDADLQRIMDLHANQLFAFEHWHNEQADLVLEKCYLVLGILVFIGAFTHLPSLRDIFFQKGERKLSPTALTNDKLWLKDDSQLSFLDTAQLRYAFLDLQWIIKPYTFYEEKPSRRLDVPSNARLPFTHAFREVGTGAFGRVSAVVVGGRHYINSSGQRYENVSAEFETTSAMPYACCSPWIAPSSSSKHPKTSYASSSNSRSSRKAWLSTSVS